jgi:DNA-binding transcriptional LysR family regulator
MINMRIMELDWMRAFVTVADTGSINRAAQKLHLSQPAVTRQVQHLEESLEVPLFDRRTKPFGLTPAARAVLGRCRQVLKAVDEVRAATAADTPLVELRIGVSPALAEMAAVEAVDRLRMALPRAVLCVTTNWSRAVLDAVRSGALDLGVVQLPEASHLPAGLTGQVVGHERVVLVRARKGPGVSVRHVPDLAEARWVLSPQGCGFRALLTDALQRVKAPPRVAVEVAGFDLQLSFVARGIGLGLVPTRVLARSRFRSKLQTLHVPGFDCRVAIWSVRGRPPESLIPALAAFDEDLRRLLGGEASRLPVLARAR